MKLPYVIDNQTDVLADILKGLLTEHKGLWGAEKEESWFINGNFV